MPVAEAQLFAVRRPGESDPRRERVRRWLAEHRAPTVQRNVLAERTLGLLRG